LRSVCTAAILSNGIAGAGEAEAASIGVYCWQLAPWPEEICFDVDDTGYVFALHGTHVGSSFLVPLDGAAVVDGSDIIVTWDAQLGTIAIEYQATISTSSLDGSWVDDLERSGDFPFLGYYANTKTLGTASVAEQPFSDIVGEEGGPSSFDGLEPVGP
jgi:hypothetical protein